MQDSLIIGIGATRWKWDLLGSKLSATVLLELAMILISEMETGDVSIAQNGSVSGEFSVAYITSSTTRVWSWTRKGGR